MKITMKLIAVAAASLAIAHLSLPSLLDRTEERGPADIAAEVAALTPLAAVVDTVWRSAGSEAAARAVSAIDAESDTHRLSLQLQGEHSKPLAGATAEPFTFSVGDGAATLQVIPVGPPADTIERVVQTGVLIALCCVSLFGASMLLVERPLRQLSVRLRRLASASGGLPRSAATQHGDAIAALASEADRLVEQVRDSWAQTQREWQMHALIYERLRRADRLSTLGQLASMIAHDLGTPLNVVSGRAMMISTTPECAPEIVSDSRIIAEQANTMTQLIRRTLDYARRGELALESVDVVALVERAIALVEPIAAHGSVTISLQYEAAIASKVDEQKVLQILTNIMINGIQALPEGGSLKLRLRVEAVAEPPDARAAAGDYICVSVEDNGVGMPKELRERVFRPLAAGDRASAIGLGLTVCNAVVREHGGWMSLESEPGIGSRVDVYLPNSTDDGEYI